MITLEKLAAYRKGTEKMAVPEEALATAFFEISNIWQGRSTRQIATSTAQHALNTIISTSKSPRLRDRATKLAWQIINHCMEPTNVA